MNAFKFKVVANKDDTSICGWAYSHINHSDLMKVLENFNFVDGYKRNREKGIAKQDLIRRWVAMCKEVQVYPGDGPSKSADQLFAECSEWADELTSAAEGVPGRDDFEEGDAWNLTLTRKFYGHAWICHQGEQYARSAKYAVHFRCPEGSTCGGLKMFRTDALERSNLTFFHACFQIYSRTPDRTCNEAGMNSARRMLNPETLDRSTMWCKHCGKGFQKQKWLLKHQV